LIYDASTLKLPGRLKADVCVIGTGPGGAMAMMAAAEAGLNVVALEAGGFLTPSDMRQREEEMLPRLYWDAASRTTRDRAVRVHQGRGVGGSSLHNINLCKRIPASIRSRWRAARGLDGLPPATWEALYAEVEALLEVKSVPEAWKNPHNRLLQAGCEALGWRGGGVRHNRTKCTGSGFCEIGCAYDAKNNVVKKVLPRAMEAGARVLSRCQAVRVDHRGGAVRGVDAVAVDPRTGRSLGEIRIDAPRVCVSASATGTAALLLRSRVPDPGGETGARLHIHPALVAAGEFDAPVRAWLGIPQTYECTQWLDLDDPYGHRIWIVPAFGHPVGAATSLPGHGETHGRVMGRYAHLAVLTAMLHDHTAGEVAPRGDLGLTMDYWPDAEDRAELMFGLWACARLLFAAGARRVFVPAEPMIVLERGADLSGIARTDLVRGLMDVTAVHPMSTVPMGDDPAVAAVDSRGRHHHVEGLWVADGSLFPTSIGVPPQVSIYAMGLHVGRALSG